MYQHFLRDWAGYKNIEQNSLEVALRKSCFQFQTPAYLLTTAHCLLPPSVSEDSLKMY